MNSCVSYYLQMRFFLARAVLIPAAKKEQSDWSNGQMQYPRQPTLQSRRKLTIERGRGASKHQETVSSALTKRREMERKDT
jgi:hypothetical protein